MDEIQKLNYEIGRLKGEKNRMIDEVIRLNAKIELKGSRDESILFHWLHGYINGFLSSYKKEE
jgi:hypothetical protein